MDLVITQTKNGVRAHRATCKRQGASISVDDATNTQIREAQPASCCKPANIGQFLRPVEPVVEYVESEPLEDLEDDFYPSSRDKAVEEAVAAGDEIEKIPGQTIAFDWKDYFWTSLGRGATVVAQSIDPTIQTSYDNKDMTITVSSTLSSSVVEEAVKAIHEVWKYGRREVKVWVRTDEYKALQAAQPSVYSYAVRREYLRGFCEGFAGLEEGAEYTKASTAGHMDGAAYVGNIEDLL